MYLNGLGVAVPNEGEMTTSSEGENFWAKAGNWFSNVDWNNLANTGLTAWEISQRNRTSGSDGGGFTYGGGSSQQPIVVQGGGGGNTGLYVGGAVLLTAVVGGVIYMVSKKK